MISGADKTDLFVQHEQREEQGKVQGAGEKFRLPKPPAKPFRRKFSPSCCNFCGHSALFWHCPFSFSIAAQPWQQFGRHKQKENTKGFRSWDNLTRS